MLFLIKKKFTVIVACLVVAGVTGGVAAAQAITRTAGPPVIVHRVVGQTETVAAALTTSIGVATRIYVTANYDATLLRPVGPTRIVWDGTPAASNPGDLLGSFVFVALAPGTTQLQVASRAYDDSGNPIADTATSLDTLVIDPLPPAPAVGVGLYLQP